MLIIKFLFIKQRSMIFCAMSALSITIFQYAQVTSLPAVIIDVGANEDQCKCVLPVIMANIAVVNCISIQFLLKHE